MDSIAEKHYCPVCGYPLGFPAWQGRSPSDEICPSCGIQFGYTDAAGGNERRRQALYREWRQRWVDKGMPWNDIGISSPAPDDWNPAEQLRNLEDQE